ncbi:hypothetical protein OKW50_007288 [Paraburkholderia youngii]|uniref:Uncharacterized protein n=1 Tax=Paraburkholderia youngii TaxID=2782701 RepID=A0A7W8LDS4_9BURK|nr:hypothetical protein [Paraburkholderia youngii]MBB5403794.1 hypothetical protein [Paraburkholderia youngii]NUX55295.1 hypothetical protein [Paraburkholderia youngii]NVI02555.1 hypothetical protein [Paraburkholderia youngii]
MSERRERRTPPARAPALARSEVAIMVEEWTRAIPEVRLDPAKKAVASSGLVNGMLELHLVWPV